MMVYNVYLGARLPMSFSVGSVLLEGSASPDGAEQTKIEEIGPIIKNRVQQKRRRNSQTGDNSRNVKRRLFPESSSSVLSSLNEIESLKNNEHWQKFAFYQGIESAYTIKIGDIHINLDHGRLWALKRRNNVIYTSTQTKKAMGLENVNTFNINDVSCMAGLIFAYILDSPTERLAEFFRPVIVKFQCIFEVIALVHEYDPDSFDGCWDVLCAVIKHRYNYIFISTDRTPSLFPAFCKAADLYGKIVDPETLKNYLYYLPHLALDLPANKRVFVDPYAEEWMITNMALWKSGDKDEMKRVGEARYSKKAV